MERIEDLISRKRYAELRDLLLPLEAPDIAQLCGDLDEQTLPLVFRLLPKEQAAEVFVELDSDQQELLIQGFSNTELKEVLDELYLDDTVDIVEEMPANVVKRILRHSDPEMRKSINEILKYPDDCAGSIMTTEFVDLKATMTVEDALKRIRRTGPDKETINICYVIDDGPAPAGLPLHPDHPPLRGGRRHRRHHGHQRDLRQHPGRPGGCGPGPEQIRFPGPAGGGHGEPAGGHRHRGRRHGRSAGGGHRGHREDGRHPARRQAVSQDRRVRDLEGPDPLADDADALRHLHGIILTHFENALAAVPVLTSYIPMLSGTGGNTGTQASTAVIRALSLGEVRFGDLLRVVWKECRVALICGVCLAAANFVKMMAVDCWLLNNPAVTPAVAAVVCATLVGTVACAKLVGSALPILAEKIGFDPAVMASPFITTIVDALSLLIYFRFATWILGV